jgi:hypothetical protein
MPADRCPGTGKAPGRSTVLGIDGQEQVVAWCAVCGRGLNNRTASGMMRAHQRWVEAPGQVDAADAVRSAQSLLAMALDLLAKRQT